MASAAAGSGAGAAAGATAAPTLDAEMLVRVPRVSAPAVFRSASSDGGATYVAYTVRRWHAENDKNCVDLRLRVDDGPVRRLTSNFEAGSGVAASPLWLDAGGATDPLALLYLSPRDGSKGMGAQVWGTDVATGDTYPVSQAGISMSTFRFVANPSFDARADAVDGANVGYIAFSAEVYSDLGADFEASEKRDKERGASGTSAMVFDSLPVRHWDEWDVYRKRNHVFVAPLRRDGASRFTMGAPIDLMHGQETDCPTKPFGGEEDYAFSPDGARIAIAARPDGAEHIERSTHIAVLMGAVPTSYVFSDASATEAPAPAKQTLQQLNTVEAWHASPSFSPDGQYLGALGMATPGYEADALKVNLWRLADGAGETHAVAWTSAALDVSFGSLAWAGRDRMLLTAQRKAHNVTYIVDLAAGEGGAVTGAAAFVDKRGVTSGVVALGSAIDGDDALDLYYSRSTMNQPALVERCTVDAAVAGRPVFTSTAPADSVSQDAVPPCAVVGAGPMVVSTGEIPADVVAACAALSDPEAVYTPGSRGDDVHSWFILPPGGAPADGAKKLPLAVVVHGGPQGAVMDVFHYRWNPQILAAAGYAVLCPNFHGSTGFGQAFCDAIRGDWGGGPLVDVVATTQAALKDHTYLDKDRVGALGASFGGYMMNWLNGNAPDGLFKCLVNHDGIFSTKTMFYTTEELWFPTHDCMGTPLDAGSTYDKWDPSVHVSKWRTPTLVIHGSRDFRLGEAEGLATFTALQMNGVPSRLVIFPDENHWVLKARNSIEWHKQVLRWLDTYLR